MSSESPGSGTAQIGSSLLEFGSKVERCRRVGDERDGEDESGD